MDLTLPVKCEMCGAAVRKAKRPPGEVLAEDVVVRLRREQILVPNKLGKGFKEETSSPLSIWVSL
jgi:hypothetical protein